MKRKGVFLILSAVVLIIDQAAKTWATQSLQPVGTMDVIPSLFRLSYARNRGVAFSLFADSPFNMQWLLAGISFAAALAVAVYLSRTGASHSRLNLALALLLAGITGNLIDRVRLGEVVDFLDFHLADRVTWPTFNIADAAICIGAAILAIDLLKDEKPAPMPAPLVAEASTPAAEETGITSSD
jgi:signal peptidase II